LATFAVPAFNIAQGDNTIGPVTVPALLSSIRFIIDMAAIIPSQPLSPPLSVIAQTSQDGGASWQQEFAFQIIGLLNRNGTQFTDMDVGESMSPPIPAGARLRLLVNSPIAFHSNGGSIITG
jgi:hypothetical protein